MSCSTSTRVTLSYKHGSENVSGKILEKKGRNKEKTKKKENKRPSTACESQVVLWTTKISFFHVAASHKTLLLYMNYGLLFTHLQFLL